MLRAALRPLYLFRRVTSVIDAASRQVKTSPVTSSMPLMRAWISLILSAAACAAALEPNVIV